MTVWPVRFQFKRQGGDELGDAAGCFLQIASARPPHVTAVSDVSLSVADTVDV
jgi:hypothetical protein